MSLQHGKRAARARQTHPVAWLALAMLLGCADGKEWSGSLPPGDYADFEANVYPVLLRDCAFSECHGGEQRFFQVFGPGRVRLDPLLYSADPAIPAEVMLSYERAVSMIASDGDVGRSLLLTKPLEAAAGGQGHQGTDTLGRNVYLTKLDPSYAVLRGWAERTAAAARGAGLP
jgi:hypothetical protein